MVDEQQTDPDNSLPTKAPDQAAPHGDDWGADWESAFQAEEFLVDEAGGATDLAEVVQNGHDDFTPNEEDNLDDPPHGDGRTEPRVVVGGESTPPVARHAGPGLASKLISRLAALPLLMRLGIPAALLLLLAAAFLLRLMGNPVPDPTQPAIAPIAGAGTTASPVEQEEVNALTIAPETSPAPADPIPPQAEKTLVEWPFTGFIIPLVDEDTKAAIFVTIELSLVIALDHETDSLPLDSKFFVRDNIFQFFVNRPLYDLRRYALAQDEMSGQLLEWLRKQWPDGDVKAVTILSYKLD